MTFMLFFGIPSNLIKPLNLNKSLMFCDVNPCPVPVQAQGEVVGRANFLGFTKRYPVTAT